MRVLFLSNFYPPASRGGFEQWCQEVAEGLVGRGHDVYVLTSTHERDRLQTPDPSWVHRDLHLEMEFASLLNAVLFFTSRKRREGENLKRLQEAVEVFEPDAVLIWGMWNFPRTLPALAEKLMPNQVVYYMGDFWPTLPSQLENYWNTPARNFVTHLPKVVIGSMAKRALAKEEKAFLPFGHVLFPSFFMREELKRKKVAPKNAKIVYGAIDTSPYLAHPTNSNRNEKISLLYVGRLTHEKGVHTAIEAVARLVREHGYENVHLTVVGDGEVEYVNHLQQLVQKEKIASSVTFMPAQPKENLPALYRQSDIFLFTSIWPEPFGRVIVEAMASGVVVVGSSVGGAAEILNPDENALIFAPNDSIDLSQQLERLIDSPALRARLAEAGRETAKNKFDIERMTEEIESYLQGFPQ